MAEKSDFAVGQRWLSNAETSLGLGVVMAVDFRSVTVLFPAVNEERNYAISQNALTRLQLSEGEIAPHVDGWQICIESVSEQDGLITYTGPRADNSEVDNIVEVALDHGVKLNQPEKRLAHGQLDHPKWFDTRLACWQHQYEFAHSGALGLVGARVELIPHQIHIAHEVGSRYAPRVLLADEVGLGKTIEAALIIHQQVLSGRAERILICVPDSLVHQWLVEMLRRVDLSFSVFDEERLEAVKESVEESGENPFEQEQRVLCSQSFIEHAQVLELASKVEWDILVVDEAHHLHWSKQAASESYQAIETLSKIAKGVLLLTATPDQLGHESHFARLRLLDPARFHNYDSFVKEESEYAKLAEAVTPLIESANDAASQTHEDIDLAEIEKYAPGLNTEKWDLSQTDDRKGLLRELIDQHGTGRLFFRNRRAAIQGFPQRIVTPYPQRISKEYELALDMPSSISGSNVQDNVSHALHPERASMLDETWPSFDPRVSWLCALLENMSATANKDKVLLICAYASTALQIAEYLRSKTSIRHTVFHEGMSIVERDKAAHFFATSEQGAQIMLCSEIGSEGRNFQFCHHLVLFDLPLNPDLLEQRIGRLDRIGQTQDINVHVPYFENNAQEVLYNIYHYGLGAFTKTCPVGSQVWDELGSEIHSALASPLDKENWQDVTEQVASTSTLLKLQIEQGRDRLLELNASGSDKIDDVMDNIVQAENPVHMMKFMTRLFDALGVIQEEKDDNSFVIRHGESMLFPIPGVSDDGLEITYKRSTATQLEHVRYITGDSELVTHCIDSVLTDVVGKSSICFVNQADYPVGAFWVEIVAVLSPSANKHLQLYRFLPPTPVHICIDAKNQESYAEFDAIFKVKPKMAQQLIGALQAQITQGIEQAMQLASTQLETVKSQALEQVDDNLSAEIDRLVELKKLNPAIREEEIDFIRAQKSQLHAAIDASEPYLDSVRILINNRK
ncbi:RNA polymerase-associated protein RapA [Ningiella sp. W23]|uniref:RNA polymerase-associated protein RapA n=1 Tax=Ningiella sp. W23 TaxID=3023715 RepID=UPI003756C35F